MQKIKIGAYEATGLYENINHKAVQKGSMLPFYL